MYNCTYKVQHFQGYSVNSGFWAERKKRQSGMPIVNMKLKCHIILKNNDF